MIDYEQLYYNLLYKYKKIKKENKELEEEINMLKKYKNENVKNIIIKEICRRKYEK